MEHTDRIAEAAHSTGMTWMKLDEKSVQDDQGTMRPAWPQPWARNAGVGAQTDVTPVAHVPSGAMIYLPPGLSLDTFLGMVRVQQ